MPLCDQSLVTLAFLWQKLSQPQFDKDLTKKPTFFEGWSWFKLNNLGLALGENLKFYTSVAKGLKLKVRKFWGLIPKFVEVSGESWIGLASIKKRWDTSRTLLNVQDGVFVKMFNMVLWRYLGVCICFVIRICQGSEYASDTQGSEYAWVCCWRMLEYVWICLKQNLK